MLTTKPVEIFLTLSPAEKKEMSAFVRSPYFNTNKNLIKLFDLVKKNQKKIESGKLGEEVAYFEMFPGKNYNYGIMKNLLSALASLFEEFLTINSIRTKPLNRFRKQVLLADEYDNRGLDRHFEKTINNVSGEIQHEPMDNYYYHDRGLIEESKYFFCSSRSDDKGLEEAIYKEMLYNICEFYRTFSRNMWKININIDNVNSKYEKDFISILAKHIDFDNLALDLKGIDEKEYDYIKLNSLIVTLLLKPENEQPYFELKQLIIDTIDNYENYERYSILTKALSYCSTAHRAGNLAFMRESLEMRKLVMEKVKFNYRALGPFSFHYFTETIMMFLHENDIDGAESFLEKYGDAVGELNKELNYNFSKAYILEAKGEYNKALERLAKAWSDDTEINIRARRLYITLYYNLNEFEAGLDAVNALKAYLKGNPNLTDQLRERYLTTAYYAEKVFKIRAMPEKYTYESIDKIHNEMKEETHIMYQWLDEKITELKASTGK